jgi:hypothetical protein
MARRQNANMSAKKDAAREDRIVMEVVVDAYGSEERATGWYCYLENTVTFPFTAHCTGTRVTSPLKKADEVEVTGMAPSEECRHELFVMIRWGKKGLAVPLSQLKPAKDADESSRQAIEDWLYWVKQGYEF